MNCSRCGTTLPDSSTFCPTCGSTTRIEPPAFSYLPPGAPPWPTTIPQGIPSKDGTTPSVGETPRAKGETKPRRSLRSILTIVAIVLLTPLVGVAITLGNLYASGQFPPNNAPQPAVHLPQQQSTPSTQGQLPTPTSFHQSVGAPKVGVSLKYPANWVEETPQITNTTSSLRLHPQQALGILFIIGRFSADATSGINSADDVNQGNLQYFSSQQGVHNLQVLQNSVPQRTIGGATWSEQDAGYQDNNGNAMRFTTIAVEHNKLYYTILLIVPDLYYSEAMQKYIQPMFDSLQFLS